MNEDRRLEVEIGKLYELTDRLKTQAFNTYLVLGKKDIEQTLYKYQDVKKTFSELKILMADLNLMTARIMTSLDQVQSPSETDP